MTLEQLPQTKVARWVDMLAPAREFAEILCRTEFVPKAMRGNADMVTAAIMYGDEIGVSPVAALQGIDVIEGRPRPSSDLMRALVLAAGHSYVVHEMTGVRCRVSGLRNGRPEHERMTVEWTIDMAKAAGLTGKPNWRSYPRAMLFARAMSDLCRAIFPDAIRGLGYMADDEEHAEQIEAMAIDVEPEKPARREIRRRTPADVHPPTLPPVAKAKDGDWRPVEDVDLPTPDTPARPLPTEPPGEDDDRRDEHGMPLVTGPQLRALHGRLTAIFGESSNDERRKIMGDLVGRTLDSSRDLTREQAEALRVRFAQVVSGNAELVQGDDGTWQLQHPPIDEPPGDDPWQADMVPLGDG